MFIVTPRFLSFVNPQKTRHFILSLMTTLGYLNERAVMEKKVYYFNFDLDERRYYFTLPGDENTAQEISGRYFSPGTFPAKLVVVEAKTTPGESLQKGNMIVPFTPKGMLYSFEIVVEEGTGRLFLLQGSSISNRIQLFQVEEEGGRRPVE